MAIVPPGRVLPSDQIKQLEARDQPDLSEGSEVVGRRSGFDSSGDKGMSVPGGLVPEASPETSLCPRRGQSPTSDHDFGAFQNKASGDRHPFVPGLSKLPDLV